MRKAFTLVELIAVIVILGVLASILVPVVSNTIKNSKESLYQSQLEEIKLAAEKWAYKNIDSLSDTEEPVTILLVDIKKAGFLAVDLRDPRNGELFPNDMEITITYLDNNYVFDVNESSGTDIDNTFNENDPTIILNGTSIEYIEYGSEYIDKGATAIDINNNNVSVDVTYYENGIEITSINTSKFTTYTVVYMATSNINGTNYTSKITRTLVMRDTTPPELVIPNNTEITLNEASSFNILDGVTAIDNADGSVDVEVSGFNRTVGDNIVKYKACDIRQNCIEKKRIVTITN